MRLTLFTRPACCLCDKAEALIMRVQRDVPFEFDAVDISQDPSLEALYGTKIPVVALDGEVVLVSRVSEFWLRRVLGGERSERLSHL
jgi:glutaredoxin